MGGFLKFIFIKPQLSFTFGNLNKAAEFVGFSLALQLGLLSSYSKKMQKWMILLISFSLAYLYFVKCRSTWIGTTCVFLYLLWAKKIPVRTFLYIILGAGALITFFEIIFLIGGNIPLNLSAKAGSFSERWQILLNTLSLIFDYPLGVGLGRFSFAAISYMKNLPHNVLNENYPLFSPYNESLRFLAEEGTIASIMLFLFFASFIYPFHKLKNLSKACPESVAFLIFFLIQSSFQYPLKQPFVLFFLPFVLAYTARYTIELPAMRISLLPWIKGSLAMYFGFATLAMGTSIYLSTYFSFDTTLSQRTYRLWKDQNLLNNILLMSYVNKKYEEVKELTLKELEREPQNLLALKYLGLANVKSGNKEDGCAQLITYNEAYAAPSSVVEEISHYCAN